MGAKAKQNRKYGLDAAVRDFVETYPSAATFRAELWELLIAAMSSEHADMWDKKQRGSKLLMVELLGALVDKFYHKVSK